MASISSTSISTSPEVYVGKVENVVVAAAGVEQAHTFPANTKKFKVFNRGARKLQLSFTAGESGTDFHTVYAGNFYGEDGIGAASTTIYFQSPLAGLVVELVSWS